MPDHDIPDAPVVPYTPGTYAVHADIPDPPSVPERAEKPPAVNIARVAYWTIKTTASIALTTGTVTLMAVYPVVFGCYCVGGVLLLVAAGRDQDALAFALKIVFFPVLGVLAFIEASYRTLKKKWDWLREKAGYA